MLVRVREEAPLSAKGVTIDRSGKYPVAKGVLLCGRESKWGRDYEDEAFEDVTVYEDRPGYLGHHKEPGNRPYEKKLCWYRNVRKNEVGLPIADMCFNPKHPYAETVLFDIENRPHEVKLSHSADVDQVVGTDGRKKIKKIVKVHSVDIVTNGGTTNSIYEDAPVAMTLKQYAKKIGPKLETADLIKLRVLVSEEGMGEAPMMPDAPGMEEELPEDEGCEGVDAAFEAACMKLVKECMDDKSCPPAVKKLLAKMKKYMMAHGSLNETDMEEEEPEETEEVVEKKTEEGAPVKKKKKSTITEEAPEAKEGRVLRECVLEGFSPTSADMPLMAGIARIEDKNERLQAIRKLKGDRAAEKPKGGTRITEKVEEAAPVVVGPTTLTKEGAAHLEQVKKWRDEHWGSIAKTEAKK